MRPDVKKRLDVYLLVACIIKLFELRIVVMMRAFPTRVAETPLSKCQYQAHCSFQINNFNLWTPCILLCFIFADHSRH